MGAKNASGLYDANDLAVASNEGCDAALKWFPQWGQGPKDQWRVALLGALER
jgi:hypothetical protein